MPHGISIKYNYFSSVYVLLMTNLSQRSSLLKMQCVLGGKYWSGGFYNCFDFQLNCRCQYQETPHPNVQLNAIFNINSILVFDYLRNSPKYMTFSRYVKYQIHCQTENVIFWTTFDTWKWQDCTGICPEPCLTIPCQHYNHI